jgi:1,4-alpha-glucan branching enzyme
MLKKKYFKTKEECEVTFEVLAEAKSVALMAESNGWEPVTMKQRKKDKVFFTKVRLPNEKQYEFRYLIDGASWENDEAADAYVPNEFGSENSVVRTFR